jgi:formylglycine-generating enzyme required for sulfatase activity
MPKIFISYRRADSQAVTDRLHEHMLVHFDEHSVFQDVDNIPFGVDFPEYLSDEVNKCDVVLVVIGTEWARIMRERAHQPDDFVRIEVESALKLGKLVIPVLVNGATMPNPDSLPDTLRDLCRKHAAFVRSNPDFRRDCLRLADGIKQWSERLSPPSHQAPPPVKKSPAKPTSVNLMPAPFEWINIPAGRGVMQTHDANITLDIPPQPYQISKYPITNAQYAKFMDAGGYNHQGWWTDQGWELCQKEKWTQPRYWTDANFNSATHPVVGVSWFEAVAFCLWLSDVTGEKIMLPTEAQWQYAAQGDDGRLYPWGDDWDENRCNHDVEGKGIGKTTSVTQFEGKNKGDSPFGVVDMAGNVWEWCLTDYDNLTNDMNSNATKRVLRGGSWNNSYASNLRAPYRSWVSPRFRNDNYGVRCVLITE